MAMKNVLGILDLHEQEEKIRALTTKRPLATLPFAGRYRLIDFPLSCMVNSGIIRVGMMLPYKSRSILDHLRSGKDWDLARRTDGLFYLPAIKQTNDTRKGNLQAFYEHLSFIDHSTNEYVAIANCNYIYNIDLNTVLRFHQNTGADITMVYYNEDKELAEPATILETSETGLVQEIAERPIIYENSKVFMGIYLLSRKKFLELISTSYERGGSDFLVDAILRHQDNMTIFGYEHTGYVAKISSLHTYYKTSMELLKPEIWEELFMGENPIYTRVKDEAPVVYKKQGKAVNSLVGNSCTIEGVVENSIIFRGVSIGKNVKVKNSVIMSECKLEDDAVLENVICDKNVIISQGKWLKGAENYPLVIEKNTVI